MNLIFLAGTAGSGKSLLTATLLDWYKEKSQSAITVNLDPGASSLPYQPDFDIREMVETQTLMESYQLGPNGALVLANDLIATKLPNIQEEIESFKAAQVIIDTPGQVELFAFRESGPFIAKNLRADSRVVLFLIDSVLAGSPSNFLSLALLSASVQIRLVMPQISVLSKSDLARGKVDDIIAWSKSPAKFEEGISTMASGEEYVLFSSLFRAVKNVSLSIGLYPVSSVTREGFVALVGEISRISEGGEEIQD
jgi:GTPase SAR1 family protein